MTLLLGILSQYYALQASTSSCHVFYASFRYLFLLFHWKGIFFNVQMTLSKLLKNMSLFRLFETIGAASGRNLESIQS